MHENEQRKQPKTAVGMVIRVLHRVPGLFYSVREIQETIQDQYQCRIKTETIHDALTELRAAAPGLLQQRTERRGPKKIPIILYSLKN